MNSIIKISAAVFVILFVFTAPVSADGIIYPYVNSADGKLTAGTSLYMIDDPSEIIHLTGSGTADVRLMDSSFKEGYYYSGKGSTAYHVTAPDARITIFIDGHPVSGLNPNIMMDYSSNVQFHVYPLNDKYWPCALEFLSPSGVETYLFGNLDSRWGTPTGLVKVGNELVFNVPNVGESGAADGDWDVRAVYNSSEFGGVMPYEFLFGTYYSEQNTPKPPTIIDIDTRTPTPEKTPTIKPTQSIVPTQNPTLTPTQTAVPTTETAESALMPFSVIAGILCAALIRRIK